MVTNLVVCTYEIYYLQVQNALLSGTQVYPDHRKYRALPVIRCPLYTRLFLGMVNYVHLPIFSLLVVPEMHEKI